MFIHTCRITSLSYLPELLDNEPRFPYTTIVVSHIANLLEGFRGNFFGQSSVITTKKEQLYLEIKGSGKYSKFMFECQIERQTTGHHA